MRQVGATLHCGARASHHRSLSCCGARAPDAQAQQLWLTGPVAPRHVGSSQTRARTCVPCIGRQILNHCATRETRLSFFLMFFLSFWPIMNHDPFCQYFFLPPTSFSFSTCEGKMFQVQYIIRQRDVANRYSQVLKADRAGFDSSSTT